MEQIIIIMDASQSEVRELCGRLEKVGVRPVFLSSLADLKRRVEGNPSRAVVLDLDSIPVDNHSLKEMKRESPGLCILALSKRQYHPDLEEAMSRYIYACLGKPVDPEELAYWLKSIHEGNDGRSDRPEA